MKNPDEDHAYEQWRQKKADETTDEVAALQTLRSALVRKSHHGDPCYHYGFLCTALSSIYHEVSERQYDFLWGKISNMLNDNSVLPKEMENNLYHQYRHNARQFAAMSHAYRLGILDQWIANQKEK